jgi:hypothetical protein
MDEADPTVTLLRAADAGGQLAAHDHQEARSSDDPTWTFARDADELTIVRPHHTQERLLIVTLNDAPRTYTFPTDAAREQFKADMETLLLHTGWSFVGFTPERRNRRDRRTFPRTTERRRWWTDGWLFYS